jgi:formyltetrahydrofolate-dependent phosphoribosylglycinamide formyltransferase
MNRKRTVILISGRGSNMTALIEAAADPAYPAEIAGVVSDRADAPGLGIAIARGVPVQAVARKDFADGPAHDAAIDKALAGFDAEIVALAGYMRRLSAPFVEKWQGRMINIHPALLPAFKGLDTHRRALEAGLRIHGCTVHFVTPEVDDGPIVAQAAVPVMAGDDESTLAARVLKAEHRIYPLALRLVAEGKARMQAGRTVFSGFADDGDNESRAISAPRPLRDEIDLEKLARITPQSDLEGGSKSYYHSNKEIIMGKIEKVSVALSSELLGAAKEAVASGAYASTSEVIREALREWNLRKPLREAEIERLRKAWQEGIESGEPRPFDPEDTKRRARERFEAAKNTLG